MSNVLVAWGIVPVNLYPGSVCVPHPSSSQGEEGRQDLGRAAVKHLGLAPSHDAQSHLRVEHATQTFSLNCALLYVFY